MISLNEYQTKAMSTRLKTADETYALLGLVGEVGEVASLIAKAVRDGPKEDFRENAAKELGDILWFIAAIASDMKIPLEDIAKKNLEKLQGRAARNTITGNGDNR